MLLIVPIRRALIRMDIFFSVSRRADSSGIQNSNRVANFVRSGQGTMALNKGREDALKMVTHAHPVMGVVRGRGNGRNPSAWPRYSREVAYDA